MGGVSWDGYGDRGERQGLLTPEATPHAQPLCGAFLLRKESVVVGGVQSRLALWFTPFVGSLRGGFL